MLLGRAVREGRLGWLGRQIYKYFAIRSASRRSDGAAAVGPLMGGIVLVNRCNERCPMCDIPQRAEGDLDTAQVKELIDQFVTLGTSGIGFTGGEPLLRADVFELIAYARGFGMPVTLNTNGLLLTERRIEQLLEAGPTNVNISLDGGTASTHDPLRGGPFFDRTVDAIRRLSQAARARGDSTTVTVVTVISEENREELETIAGIVRDVDAHRWGVMPLHNTREGTGVEVVPSQRMAGVVDWLRTQRDVVVDNSPQYLSSLENAWRGEPFPRRCNAGYTSLFVDSALRVYPCLGYFMMGRSVHHLRPGQTLGALWHSPEYGDVRRETLECRRCYLNCQSELNFTVPI